MRFVCFLLLSLSVIKLNAQTDSLRISAHDPALIKREDAYYLFSTGNGIKVQRSKDLKTWEQLAPVFATPPQWALQSIPGFKGHIWAPDISFRYNQYYLYYSVSSFGKNSSAIGVATNKTLDPSDPAFKWVDHGLVIASMAGRDHWNAIDPNLIVDQEGRSYLAFGSFWDGIKLVELKEDLLTPKGRVTTIASRKKAGESGNNAIEAPFIYWKNGFYYLFASIDYCCQGEKSTYKMIVGRSKSIEGPYLDQLGAPMLRGGGTVLLAGDVNWYGVGHNAVYRVNGEDILIFHGYDAHDKGKAKLRVAPLTWKNSWPFVLEKP